MDNIRLPTNIIQDVNLTSKKLLLLGLDIHKAFGSVSWQYMVFLLQRFKDEFIHAFQALYPHPKTCIKLPGCTSDFLQLGRGT